MARSEARTRRSKDRARLPEQKGRELVGVLLALGGLLLLVSLLSHHPADPSIFHVVADNGPVRNLIGPAGAELSAVGVGLFGVAVLALPAVLFLLAFHRLARRGRERVIGRGVGLAAIVIALPPLLQLALGTLTWRGSEVDAGGAIGVFLSRVMVDRLGVVGALLVVIGVLLVGLVLTVQSSLEDTLRVRGRQVGGVVKGAALALERQRERRERDRARRQVVAKHLERARVRQAERQREQAPSADQRPVIEPARVTKRTGLAHYNLRRVAETRPPSAAPAAAYPMPRPAVAKPDAPAPERPAAKSAKRSKRVAPRRDQPTRSKPQSDLGFSVADSKALPPLNLLNLEEEPRVHSENDLVRLGEVIRARCAEFGVEGTVDAITPGPVITVFEFQPAPGVKVSQIVNLQDDLALSLKAEAIRIDRIPGRSTLGIEVPNEKRSIIHLGPLLLDDNFARSPSALTMALGRDLHGRPYTFDLASMPHLLVAGATGAGKSVGLQSMITSILYKANRDQVKFIFIDPKRIELGVYADIPHLKTEVVVEPKKAANALRWAVSEMERRYRLLAEVHVRSIEYYNRAILDPEVQRRLALRDDEEAEVAPEELQPLPYYVVIIDELADLMMVSSSDVEQAIARLAQMARAVGIHLIVATQRPSVDVLTGTIKANFPCRMSFATASRHDSRTILDQVGAEKLLGKGDMLFLPPGSSRPIRLHGAYVSEQETAALIRWLKKQGKPDLDPTVLQAPAEERGGGDGVASSDELFEEAARLVVSEGHGSASFLQRRMRVGFSRAARLIDMLEQDGILGPAQGSKPREVLVKPDYFEELDRTRQE